MATKFADQKEAELIARLDDVTVNKKVLTDAEAKALEFEVMLFLIRTRGL